MQIKITEKDNGITIKEYLSRLRFSSRMVTRLKNREDGIKVNGEKKTVRFTLSEGDLLELKTEDEAPSKNIPLSSRSVKVLYEDEDFLAVDKPPSTPIHPSRNHTRDTLASEVMSYYAGRNFVFRVLTRLDRDTSGVVIIAKNAVAAASFSRLLEKREVKKEYLAICEGIFTEKRGKISLNIHRPDPRSILREASESEGAPSLTLYEVQKEGRNASLVLFSPVTGRTHQIRVHTRALGHPIISDTLYHTPSEYISRQALHAHRITFIHPFTKKKTVIVSPLPEDMKNAERMLFSE